MLTFTYSLYEGTNEYMIYTTYFANCRNIKSKDKLVSIARYTPPKVSMKTFPMLAPDADILSQYKKDGDKQKFKKKYEEYLNTLNVEEVAKFLDGYILCCYEKRGDFCHRNLVAEWFNKNGFECREVQKGEDI